MDPSRLQELANAVLCQVGYLPSTYLGLPIGGHISRINAWDPIIERMDKKLATWKGGLLSIGGRATLVKASLSSLPMYYMSIFLSPMGVIEKIRRI